jgi:hypothetical protein
MRPPGLLDLELFSRPGCHLCDAMKQAIREAARGLEIRLRETDVTGSADLERRFGNDVPVLFVNGIEAFRHRATAAELRRRFQEV